MILSLASSLGMVTVPGAEAYRFVVRGVEIEHRTPRGQGVDVQFPWERTPTMNHDFTMGIDSFFMDRTPITNAAYEKYLTASGYTPSDSHNFLKNWRHHAVGGGRDTSAHNHYTVPAGLENLPVTYVSLAEAAAYCTYYHKRLPNSWEWQYAAQGYDGRKYPWGDTYDHSRCPPLDTTNNSIPGPSEVDAFPNGASPFGVLDLVGNVWQYTNEFYDKHTRAVLLRGGSNYYPTVSRGALNWYFPNSLKMRTLNTHGKYFLMSDSYERAGTIGFRCVVDI